MKMLKNACFVFIISILTINRISIEILANTNNNLEDIDNKSSEPPPSFDLASKDSLYAYNFENNKDLKQIGKEKIKDKENFYIIIELQKNKNDLSNTNLATTGSAIKVPKPQEGLIKGNMLQIPNNSKAYMVKFSGLSPNINYYFRTKTVLSFTKTKNVLKKDFIYMIQMSDNPDFFDYHEVSTMPIPSIENNDNIKTLESKWSDIKSFRSLISHSAYDGEISPIIPSFDPQDFEILQNKETRTLTYRFKEKDSDKESLKDNQLSQRFISKLVNNKNMIYEIDMTYDEDIENHIIEMPYSIYSAFAEREVDVKIKTNNVNLTLPSNFLDTSDVKELIGLGLNSNIKLSLSNIPQSTPKISNNSYTVPLQRFSILVSTPIKTISIENLGKEAEIEIKIDKKYSYRSENIRAVIGDENPKNEQILKTSFDGNLDILAFNTYKATNYSALIPNVPLTSIGANHINVLYNVSKKINITDMYSYDPEKVISALEFNNLICAIAYDNPEVAIKTPLNTKDFQALGKSQLLVSGYNISNESAINSLVKLYEIKTKSTIENYYNIDENYYNIIENSDPKYELNLQKGAKIGFFDAKDFDPKKELNFGDLISMLNIIVMDSNM